MRMRPSPCEPSYQARYQHSPAPRVVRTRTEGESGRGTRIRSSRTRGNHEGYLVGDDNSRPGQHYSSTHGAAIEVRRAHIRPPIVKMVLHDPNGMHAWLEVTETDAAKLTDLIGLQVDEGIATARTVR